MKITRFEEIESWKEARKLTAQIYRLSGGDRFARDLGLRDQIRRAAVSVMANIAEGFGRNSNRDFVRFLCIANASALEVQSHLYVCLDLQYINAKQFEDCYQQAKLCSHLIGGFINYLKQH